jgi:hypothetical protein
MTADVHLWDASMGGGGMGGMLHGGGGAGGAMRPAATLTGRCDCCRYGRGPGGAPTLLTELGSPTTSSQTSQ